jgi:hypothetical protein
MLEIIEAILCSFQKEILSQVVVKILCWRYPFHLMFRMEFNLFDYYMSMTLHMRMLITMNLL